MPRSLTQTRPVTLRINLVQRVTRTLIDAFARRRDRAVLARLDDHLLRDIGLSPDEARTEAAKPFWRR